MLYFTAKNTGDIAAKGLAENLKTLLFASSSQSLSNGGLKYF